ncbi:MAG: siderophore ABC transporter substrate-binding protein [Qingshengfaniella sp.]
MIQTHTFRPVATVLTLAALMTGPGALHAQQITIAHNQGETVLADTPETVLVTDWAAFDNLDALGIAVAGVPSSNAPGYLADRVSADAARLGSLQEPDIEGIVAAAPDLVIIGARSRRSYATLAPFVPTMDASISNEDLIAGVEARLTQYGAIFGVEDRAAALIANLEAKLDTARAAAADQGSGLVIITNGGKLGVYGPGSRVSWIYKDLQIPSVFDTVDDRDHGGDAISFEYLVETAPDWLFVIDRDAGVGNTGAARELLDNELLHQTGFWQNDQIVYLDSQAAYVTMHGYQGIMLLLDQLIEAFSGTS